MGDQTTVPPPPPPRRSNGGTESTSFPTLSDLTLTQTSASSVETTNDSDSAESDSDSDWMYSPSPAVQKVPPPTPIHLLNQRLQPQGQEILDTTAPAAPTVDQHLRDEARAAQPVHQNVPAPAAATVQKVPPPFRSRTWNSNSVNGALLDKSS